MTVLNEYPSGRLLDVTYGASASIADCINRVDKLSDDSGGSPSTVLAAYSYLGLGQIVIEDFQQPQVRLDYYQGTPGTYAGLDLFGRIVSQLWTAYGASAVADQFGYGFDLSSNRIYRAHNNATAQDEFYGYDDLLRLATAQRGTLNSTNTGISGTPAAEFDYTFDATGNWGEYVEKTAGTTSLDQTRSHTEANEISAIGASAGPTWLTPVYDAVGNMTTMPNPADLTAGLNGEYDAWGRLVQVADGTMVLAQFRYDGLNRRIVENLPSGGSTLVRHAYYNSDWQLLETRTGSSSSTPPASLPVEYQYVWSLRYIDAPILRDAPNETGAPRYYFLTDANMNITALLDASAAALERYLYSPYGTPVIFDGTWSTIRSSSAYNNGLVFAGYRFDPATGLYLARNRELHAQLGTWTSRDPAGYVDRTNLREYAAGSPVNTLDPLGLANCTRLLNQLASGAGSASVGAFIGIWGIFRSGTVGINPDGAAVFHEFRTRRGQTLETLKRTWHIDVPHDKYNYYHLNVETGFLTRLNLNHQKVPEFVYQIFKAKSLKYAGHALVVVGIALDAADIITACDKGRAIGGAAGGLAGGEVGAFVGSFILPGPGTIVFGFIGGAVGNWAGQKFGGQFDRK